MSKCIFANTPYPYHPPTPPVTPPRALHASPHRSPLAHSRKIVIPLQSFAQQATAAAPASQPGSAAEADANADAAAAAELAASGSPCSSSQPQACQGGAAGASQPPPQQQHDEILQSVAAEITTSRIVDAVLGKARELVDSVAAVTQQLKRLKTLQVNPAYLLLLHSKPCQSIAQG